MDFIDRVDELLDERKIKRVDVFSQLNISSSTMRGWRQGKIPSIENAQKIADFLDVSLDYLIAGKSDDFFLASDEKNLVLLFRAMKPQDRELLFDFCEMLLKRQKKVNIGYATERDEALKVAEKED